MSRSAELSAWSMSRTEGIDANPTVLMTRANQFATKVGSLESATLLLRREESTTHGYLLAAGDLVAARQAAGDLARTVGAKAEEVPTPAELAEDNYVGWLTVANDASVARDPQVNADPAETARILAQTLRPGTWVAVAARRSSNKEGKAWQRWLRHRLGTGVPNHHSMGADALVVSVYAGAPEVHEVESILEATRSAMPGFDTITKPVVPTEWSAARPAALGALAVSLLAAVATMAGAGWMAAACGALVGVACAVVAGLRFRGVLASPFTMAASMAATARFAPPPTRRGRPKAPRAEVTHGEKPKSAFDGDYPLHPAAFKVGPQVVVGVVAPQAGAMSGVSVTRHRDVPSTLLTRVGPLVGDTVQGPAHLPAGSFYGGCAIIGKPGSGKSVMTRSLFGWSCLEKQQPSGLPGFPGARNALIAFESKGGGAVEYQRWAEATGEKVVLLDLLDPSTRRLDLFDIDGDNGDRAAFIANAMRYAFGEQSIGPQTFETLLALLPVAMEVTDAMATAVPGVSPGASEFYYTHLLLGGAGEATGVALFGELAAAATRQGASPSLAKAVSAASHIYGPAVTTAQRRSLLEAPRNKLRQIVELEQWWSPSRPRVTWRQVLTGHRAIVINTGSSAHGVVEDSVSEQLSAMLMYSLRKAIQRDCAGWDKQGRSVSLFADELSLLAGSTSDVIAWLKDVGREYGVKAFLATQRPAKLSQSVREVFMNFSTLVTFGQEDLATARSIAEAVSGDVGDWEATDVLNLPPYTAIVRTHIDQQRMPAFTTSTRFFEEDRTGYATMQGFTGESFTMRPVVPTPVAEPAAGPSPVPAPPFDLPSAAAVEDDEDLLRF